MARLTGPLHSLKAQKQLGHSLIFKAKGNRAFATGFNVPGGNRKTTASPSQLDRRMIYNYILIRWQTFSDAERTAYNDEAKANNLKMSGWNLFCSRAFGDLPTYLGLQNYYSFNQIVNGKYPDLSGNGFHATPKPSYPSNAPQLVDSINSNFGKATSFDGIDDYITGYDNLKANKSMTVMFWLKRPNLATSGYPWGHGSHCSHFTILMSLYYFYVYGDGTCTNIFRDTSAFNSSYNNKWILITVTYDETTQTYKWYRNKTGKKADTGILVMPNHDWIMGMQYLAQSAVEQTIDDLRIFDRTLVLSEITKHYELGKKDVSA